LFIIQNFYPKNTMLEFSYIYFQSFAIILILLILAWLINITITNASIAAEESFHPIHYIGVIFWLIGFTFEAGGDLQLSLFKSKPENKGKLLTKEFWKYSRYPNYFSDATVWWSYVLFSIAPGYFLPVPGTVLMIFFNQQDSDVALLEKDLMNKKPDYKKYIQSTSAFIHWFKK